MRPNPASGKTSSAGRTPVQPPKWQIRGHRRRQNVRTPCDAAESAILAGFKQPVMRYRVSHAAHKLVGVRQMASARQLGSADHGRTIDQHDANEVHFGHVRKTGPSSPNEHATDKTHGADRGQRNNVGSE